MTEPEAMGAVPAVAEAGPGDGAEWDAFVKSQNGATPYAAFQWPDILHDCYGAEPVRLVARGPGGISGVLSGYMPRPKSVRTLYSAAFVSRDAHTMDALLDAAAKLCAERRIARSIIATGTRPPARPCRHWTRTAIVKPLPRDEDAAWQGLRKKTRYTIRRATGLGVTVEHGPARHAEFYQAYRSRMADKDVPFHAMAFFDRIASLAGADMEWLFAVKDGRLLGGMTFVRNGRIALYQLSAAYSDAMPLGINHLLMWEAMRVLIRRGVERLDMGESTPGGGVYAFKTVQFGGVPEDVHYCDLARGPDEPDAGPPPARPFERAIGLAMRIAPISLRSRWLMSQAPYGRLL